MASLYTILGVKPEDDATIIKQRYRKLAKEYHPDSNGGDVSKIDEFKKVAVAYAVLGNERKRAEYDRQRRQDSSPGSMFGPGFNDLVDRVATEGVTGENWNELFSDLFNVATTFNESAPEHIRSAGNKFPSELGGPGGIMDTLEDLFGTRIKPRK